MSNYTTTLALINYCFLFLIFTSLFASVTEVGLLIHTMAPSGISRNGKFYYFREHSGVDDNSMYTLLLIYIVSIVSDNRVRRTLVCNVSAA